MDHPANKIALGDNPQGPARPRQAAVGQGVRGRTDLAWRLDLKNTFVQNLAAATGMRPDLDKPEVFI